jgi:hypothetical protein
LAPAVVVVAVVAVRLVPLPQQPEVAAARPVPLPQQPEVAAARPVPLPRQPEVAAVVVAVVLVQGLVASEILRSR